MIGPKYYQVKTEIMKRINDGVYKPNQLMPSETEYMRLFDISRITIRKALDELAKEGLVYRIQGKGTYVSTTRKRGINILRHTSHIAELSERGYNAKRIIIRKEIITCDEQLANEIGLSCGEQYFLFERTYTGNDIPNAYEISYYLYSHVLGIEKVDLQNQSIRTVLKEYEFDDKPITRTSELQAILAESDICDRLQMKPKMPLLRIKFCAHLLDVPDRPIDGKCLEYTVAYWRTDIIPVNVM